jgi:hypothetical protein
MDFAATFALFTSRWQPLPEVGRCVDMTEGTLIVR